MGEFLHVKELLHNITQGLLYPTMIILLILIIFAVGLIASIIIEAIVERRHFKVALPQLMAKVNDAAWSNLHDVIEQSGLLRSQKNTLHKIVAYSYLPQEARVALAKKLLAEQEGVYWRITSRTDMVAKISPMFGLMGTLIPLGPGVVAMGQGQVDLLSSSIEIAFDTTIAGLIVAAIALFIGRFRKAWYEEYLAAQETIITSILEKASACIDAGENLGNAESAAEFIATLPKERRVFGRGKKVKGKAVDLDGLAGEAAGAADVGEAAGAADENKAAGAVDASKAAGKNEANKNEVPSATENAGTKSIKPNAEKTASAGEKK